MRRLSWLVPTIYIIFLMLPIYWLLNMSFKTTNEILGTFSLWPRQFTLDNYTTIFTDPTWYMGYVNSITYVTINTVLSVSVALPALFVLALLGAEALVGRLARPPRVRNGLAAALGLLVLFVANARSYEDWMARGGLHVQDDEIMVRKALASGIEHGLTKYARR